MHSIAENIKLIRSTLPEGVQLLCVSKFHPAAAIQQAYDSGERLFGESRVQELVGKHACLPQDIQWHFIGHLQTNKIRPILPFVSLIHGVDSWHLMEAINREAERIGRVVDVLLEVRVAQEQTKYGFLPDELRDLLHSGKWKDLHYLKIRGLMGMASLTDNEEQIKREFSQIRDIYDDLCLLLTDKQAKILSMGMSDDYLIAVGCGSNLVRIGTNIFGSRE